MNHKKKKSAMLAGALILVLFPVLLAPHYKIVEKVSADRLDRSFSFGLPAGVYDRDITLELQTNIPFADDLEIYYTTDGSMPDRQSEKYTHPLTFCVEPGLKAVCLRASVYDKEGELAGGPYDGTWFLTNVPESLEGILLVSLQAEWKDLFGETAGILYPPVSYVTTGTGERWKEMHAQNFAQHGGEWECQAQIQIFEGDGRMVVDQGCGLSVSGKHGSLTHYPFSLNCRADVKYDADNTRFSYNFFEDRVLSQKEFSYYNSISLKNGGNDYYWGDLRQDIRGTMLRNTIGLRLAREAGLLASEQRIALVFLNGDFYNLTYLQANSNKKTIAVMTGLNDDYIITRKEGEKYVFTYFALKRLYHSFPDLENSKVLEGRSRFEERVDMEELFRYYAFECIVGNGDWPKNNYQLWRYIGKEQEGNPYTDGRYRHWVYDLDCIYDLEYWLEDPWTALFEKPDSENCLLITLMQVESYRNQFVNTVLDLLNSPTFEEDHILQVIEEENNQYAPWYQWLYGAEAEQGREDNIRLLKDNVLKRRAEVMGYLQKYFQVENPYRLTVLAAEGDGRIWLNSLTLENQSFTGTYDAAYPVTITYRDSRGHGAGCWMVNGVLTDTAELVITRDMIKDGCVTLQPIAEGKKE